MFIHYVATVLIAAVTQINCFDGPSARREPYPICEECRDPELTVAPGIGFDLTHSYG
jgi:hypothetical protein